jgi:hypothetical protein
MWNTLISGTGLSIATGCALFLYGLSLGLLVAGLCLASVAASGDRQANSLQEYGATISDDEIELVVELVREAVAGSGWTLCGDCYTRKLLVQLPLPPALLFTGPEEPATHCHADPQLAPANAGSCGSLQESVSGTCERSGWGQVYPQGRPGAPCGAQCARFLSKTTQTAS